MSSKNMESNVFLKVKTYSLGKENVIMMMMTDVDHHDDDHDDGDDHDDNNNNNNNLLQGFLKLLFF